MRAMRAMTAWTTAAVVVAAALAPAAWAQPRITLETGVKADRTLRFEIRRMIEVGQRAGDGDESVTTVEVKARIETDVASAEGDGSGEMTGRVLMYEVRVQEPDGATRMTFDLTEDRPSVTDGLLAFDSVLRRTRLAWDVTARGGVENLTGVDEIAAFASGAEDAPPHAFDFFEPGALTQTLSLLTDPAGGIGTHGLREEWTMERRVPFGRAGAFDLVTTSSIQLAQAGFAAIASITEYTLLAPNQRDAGTPVVSLEESDGQALINWDTDDGGARQHSGQQTLVTGWTVGELTLTQRQESRVNVVRLD